MTLRELAAKKAVCVRHYGTDDPRTVAAASELRIAKLKALLAEPPLTDDERAELLPLLTA